MKRMAVVAVVVVGLGCAPASTVLRGASKTGVDDLSRCAMRQLVRLGYTVRDGGPEPGVVHAAKNTATTRMVLHSGKDAEDRIVVTIAPGGPGGRSTVLVAGDSLFWGAEGRKLAERPAAGLAREMRQVLEACGILDAAPAE